MLQILAAALKGWPLGGPKRHNLRDYDADFRAEVETLFRNDLAALKRSPMERRTGAQDAPAPPAGRNAGGPR